MSAALFPFRDRCSGRNAVNAFANVDCRYYEMSNIARRHNSLATILITSARASFSANSASAYSRSFAPLRIASRRAARRVAALRRVDIAGTNYRIIGTRPTLIGDPVSPVARDVASFDIPSRHRENSPRDLLFLFLFCSLLCARDRDTS